VLGKTEVNSSRSVIVLGIDRLRAGYLGPYGNTWVETPEWNRLASEATLFEHAIADAHRLEDAYRSYWYGTHAMCEPAQGRVSSIAQAADSAGVAPVLMTDEPRLAHLPGASDFGERIPLAVTSAEHRSESVEQTRLGQFFTSAIDWLSRARAPYFLWLHAQGLDAPWDAPPGFRERFVDEEDPEPPDFVDPPDERLGQDVDPDELWGIAQAYAGQVLLLDVCLSTLREALVESTTHENTLLVLTSPRGIALGEHGYLGPSGDRLFGEVLHTPLLVRRPDLVHASTRSQTLVQPGDLYATVLDWLGAKQEVPPDWGRSLLELTSDETAWQRDHVCSIGSHERSIRTPAWFLRAQDATSTRLYAKPDDRWEVNEVADRCGDVAQGLIDAIDQFQQFAQQGRLAELPHLPELLTEESG
jgi:arylsulfatase A-like enzyme